MDSVGDVGPVAVAIEDGAAGLRVGVPRAVQPDCVLGKEIHLLEFQAHFGR